MSGLFITFEGVEGCGKTTQIGLLEERLVSAGREVVLTREPGGTPIAEAIRDVLLDLANGSMSAMAELFLYEAARAQHVDELIRPALERGAVVLCDRFADSTTAYQGGGRGLPESDLRRLHELATGGVWPSLTIVLDLAVACGLGRARGRGRMDRIERESVVFHERVRAVFLALGESEPERVKIVDASRPVEDVAEAVWHCVDVLFRQQ